MLLCARPSAQPGFGGLYVGLYGWLAAQLAALPHARAESRHGDDCLLT